MSNFFCIIFEPILFVIYHHSQLIVFFVVEHGQCFLIFDALFDQILDSNCLVVMHTFKPLHILYSGNFCGNPGLAFKLGHNSLMHVVLLIVGSHILA
jgi:hypothetical protein